MPLLTTITSKQLTAAGAGLLDLTPRYEDFVLDQTSYNEGDTITATVTSKFIDDNTTVNYTSTGLSTNDLTSGSLSGTFTIVNNTASVQFVLANDGLTEGTDNFTITLAASDSAGNLTESINATAPIEDTSNDPTKALFLDDNDNAVTVNSIVGPTSMQLSGVFAVNPTVPFGIEGRTSGATTTVNAITANTGTVIEIDDTGNSANFTVNEELNLSGVSATVTEAATSMDEGASLNFNVTTSGLPNGYTLYWTVSRPDDFMPSSGSFTITNSAATVTVTTLEDVLTEGAETFTLSIRSGSTSGNILDTSGLVTINDTSLSPTYTIIPAVDNVDEGVALGVTVNTERVPDATTLYWTIGTGAQDFDTTSGSFVINTNTGSFNVQPTADFTTEGSEFFVVDIRTGSTTGPIVASSTGITINDTSVDPTYTLTGPGSDLSEGDTFTVTLTTTGVDDGTILGYTITGINEADLASGSLNGSFNITSGTATAQFTVVEDLSTNTEGTEVFSIQLNNGLSNTFTANILDTSKIDWQMNVSGIASGRRHYIISGTDVLGSFANEFDPSINMSVDDTITFSVTPSGQPLWIKTAPTTGTGDAASGVVNNGAENGSTLRWTPTSAGTFYYQSENQSRMSGIINVATAGSSFYRLTAPGNTVTEGQTLTVTLTTTGVSNGTQVPYTVTGITSADLSAGSLTGNFTVNNDTATQNFTFVQDALTENESFIITLDNGQSNLELFITDA